MLESLGLIFRNPHTANIINSGENVYKYRALASKSNSNAVSPNMAS